ncbi:hypothetical protein [Streptomyces albireticuli]|uniref:Uncharacterized protein n=1 Tax=Streptomyces albireticuli TaxID=1940 RepID=A0A2A2D599_9ACTN|nr:hypothetical protein [Streptomyces albireticuli]MCD9196051.1 hypothetical protein [Streptomyces albireticuli]PAU46559.1 hypothetical protein CK936_23485 [Streptomyces albireticuli]
MGRRVDKVIGSREARAEYRAAKEELHRVSCRDQEETDDFLAANGAVIEAEKKLPRWRRYPDAR